MRTIEKILKYNFSEKQIEEMKKSGIINGCGGKGGVDFSEVIEIFFKKFQNFKNEKLEQLWSDIEQLCYEHDYDFYIQKGFKKANFDFAWGVFKLVKSWTSFSERFLIFLIIFFLLNKYGKKYYTSPQPSPQGEGETPPPFRFPPQGGGRQIMHHLYKRKITAVYEKITAVRYKIKGVFIK